MKAIFPFTIIILITLAKETILKVSDEKGLNFLEEFEESQDLKDDYTDSNGNRNTLEEFNKLFNNFSDIIIASEGNIKNEAELNSTLNKDEESKSFFSFKQSNGNFEIEKVKNYEDEDTINISDYKYPLPQTKDEILKNKEYTIAIVATTDLHGSALKKKAVHIATNTTYTYGGLDFMASEIEALKLEWGNRLLWLDGGDQFQGGLETKLSNGSLITEFFNIEKLNGSAIGNHEFDFGQAYLINRLNKAKFDYLAANIEDTQHKKEFFNNLKTSKVYEVGNVKVGVIGLSTLLTPITSSGKLDNITFLDYVPVIIEESINLKQNEKVDLVVITSHIGTKCSNKDLNVNKLRYYQAEVEAECNKSEEEMNQLLANLKVREIKDGVTYVDAVVGGHTHMNTHHFIEQKPVVSSENNGLYFNVIYITFDIVSASNDGSKVKSNLKKDKSNKELVYNKEKTVIEGPIPVCERMFSNIKSCSKVNDENPNVGAYKPISFHGKKITSNAEIKKLLDFWEEELKPYEKVISMSDVRLKMGKSGNSQLGNIYADCFKNYTSVDFSIVNSGSFRTEWSAGEITLVNLYDMSPFGGKIFSFKINGSDLKRLIQTIVPGIFQPYLVSGLKIFTRNSELKNGQKIDVYDIKLSDDSDVIDNKEYEVSLPSFLIQNYGDDFKKVKDWLKPEKLVDHGEDRKIIEVCLTQIGHITKNTSSDIRYFSDKIEIL